MTRNANSWPRYPLKRETYSETCTICGEGDADAEMFIPDAEGLSEGTEDDSFPVHAECGLQNGWEVA